MSPTFQVITLFPELFEPFLQNGVIGQAHRKGLFQIQFINPREFTQDAHRTVDDKPFGGGDGMVMLAEPLAAAISKSKTNQPSTKVIYLSAQGEPMSAELASEMSTWDAITFVCGRYGGIDQRVISSEVDREICVGDFVVSGGELPAMMVLDGVLRKRAGVLGSARSAANDSFEGQLLEAPQFTRPRELWGKSVPEVLTGGDHAAVDRWREAVSVLVTFVKRPDLFRRNKWSPQQRSAVLKILKTLSQQELEIMDFTEAQVLQLEAEWK